MAESDTGSNVWKGTPSQWINIVPYAGCVLFSVLIVALAAVLAMPLVALALIVPFSIGAWKWINIRCKVYSLTTQRLLYTTGVFSRRTDEIELYRVKDTAMIQPFLLRLVGLGNIILYTSDRTTPEFHIHAVPAPEKLRDRIRNLVEKRRDVKRVREIDGFSDHDGEGAGVHDVDGMD